MPEKAVIYCTLDEVRELTGLTPPEIKQHVDEGVVRALYRHNRFLFHPDDVVEYVKLVKLSRRIKEL